MRTAGKKWPIFVGVRLTKNQHQEISSIAQRDGNPFSSTLRRLLTVALRSETTDEARKARSAAR